MRLPRHKVVEQKVLDGQVTVRVRRPTWNEAQAIKTAAESGNQTEMRDLIMARIVGIEGLELEEVGPITTAAQAFELLDVDTLNELMRAVADSGRPTGDEVGKSLPQPSGAGSTGPGTAVPVDPAE